MNAKIALMATLICLISSALPVISQADNGGPFIPQATQQALQDQGFIRPDTGGPTAPGEMPLNNFRDADNLNYGGLFGPLSDGWDPSMGPFPGAFGHVPLDGLPNARDMGFGSDNDRYRAINKETSSA